MFETVDGQTVYCTIENEQLARELGERLYTWVSVKGRAKWDARSLELEDFTVIAVEDYTRTASILKAFSELSSIAGKYYSDVTDVEGYISDLRNKPSEE